MAEENQPVQSGQKKLAPADFRVDSFDPSVKGQDPLVQGGTPVPKSREKEVREAAERSGIELREVE